MNTRKIREDLGRVKASCMRRDFERALFLTISALNELGGQAAPSDLRGDFRTAMSYLVADPEYKARIGEAGGASGGGQAALLAQGGQGGYQPGAESELLATLNKMYRAIKGQENEEEYQAALQRKLAMDHHLRDGRKKLAEGKPSEADAFFAEALALYRDETSIFGMMAKAMMDAGEYVRALGHVRAGLKVMPQNPDLLRMAEECAQLRQKT